MKTMDNLTGEQLQWLQEQCGQEYFSTGHSHRELHTHDISPHQSVLPAAVVWPDTTDMVAKVLGWSYDQGIPVTPWGAGTSTEGNPLPIYGGLILDMTRMDKILAIRADDLQVDVQPGVFRKELNRKLSSSGLFFPIDPGADATIGGMIANNASGVQTVKYGATKDYVLQMQVVLPDGKVIKTGCKARKSSSGYDLTRLFIGSEGTLGVVTEATLRLCGVPEHHLAATVTFDTLEAAAEAVASLIGSGLEPAALELMMEDLIALMNREKGLDLPEKPMLFCEFHGISQSVLEEMAGYAQEICEYCGARTFQFGTDEQQRANLWRARHEAWETINRAHPGKETLIVDAAIPISRYPEMAVFARQQVVDQGIPGYVFGHAGDGNLHVVMAGDPADEIEWAKLEAVNHHVVERAIELGGTCTGEHGVGIGKCKFMKLEHGEGYDLMKKIKDLIDPKGLLNPGKMFQRMD